MAPSRAAMAIPLLDLEALAKACVDGDLDAFAAAGGQLGWTFTQAARVALREAVADTNYHRTYSYGVSSFTLAQAIGLIAEAASNESGIAVTEQVRSLRLGKEVAIAFRHDGQVHFGVRYASNLPMNVGNLWAELKPWFKVLEKNRTRLEGWAKTAEGVVSVPLVTRRASVASSGAELLAAVIEDPDDVDRRLVYADWLVAQGDAQGELIQLCERRREHGAPGLKEKIAALEQAYGERIAGEVAQLASSYTLDRGFVTRIEMSAPTFAKHGERLLASHPIDALYLKPVNDKALARLAKAPALKRLRVLHISQIIGRERPMSFDELCRSPHFDSLRRLEVWTWESRGDPQQAFAQLRAPSLRSLFLYQVDSTVQILAGLARNESVKLRALEVSWRQRIANVSLSLGAPVFEQLETLRIDIDSAHVSKWFEGVRLPALKELQLGDDFVIERLSFPSLRQLSLGGGRFDGRSLIELIERHPRLEALRVWDMEANEVNRALELVLGLAQEHPLARLALPTREADPELLARVEQRFLRDWPTSPIAAARRSAPNFADRE